MSLSERFKRLPEEQQLRSEESDRQARDASELLRRLRVTRQEAEKLAKEEIERTRRTQREELEIHPEIVELKKRLRIAEREKDLWERKKKDQERFYNVELESLKREEAAQLNRFNSAQEEELKSRREYENMQREREQKEETFKELDMKIDTLKREEESQFVNDLDFLKRKMSELESGMPKGDCDTFKGNLEQIQNEIRLIEEFQDRAEGERKKLGEKERQAADDLLKAQSLHKDAKNIEQDKIRELDTVNRGTVAVSYEKAQKTVLDAEKHLHELESSHAKLQKERDICDKTIEDKSRRIQAIRSEIERLQDELDSIQRSQTEDYTNLYNFEDRFNSLDMELRDIREHLNAARTQSDFYFEEKKRETERISQIEQEIASAARVRQEAEGEQRRAMDLCDEIGKKCNEADLTVKHQNERLEQLNRNALDIQAKLDDFARIKSAINENRILLSQVQARWNEWNNNRLAPLQKEFDSVKAWLSNHPKIETPPSTRSNSVWTDLERIRKRIGDLQSRYPVVPANFEDVDSLHRQLEAKENEIKSRLSSRIGPISLRLSVQFEREAESLMRAEIAATHERKQEAIDHNANELSQLRVSLKPKVALDQEAQDRLWKVNQETGETGAIADQVIQLCQSKNITVKERD